MKKIDKFVDVPCRICGAPRVVVNPAWLLDRRLRAKLSLRQLGVRVGFSAPYLSDVERGRRNCTERVRVGYEALRAAVTAA